MLKLIDYSHFAVGAPLGFTSSSLRHAKSFGLCQQLSQHAHIGRLHEMMIKFGLAGVPVDFVLAVTRHSY